VPATVLLVGVFGIPIVRSVWMSFQDNRGMADRGTWNGVANYRKAFGSSLFWQVLAQTVVWTVGVVAVTTVVSFALANVLDQHFRGRRLFRVAIIVPWATSLAFSAVVWKFALQPKGLVNRTLELIGLDRFAVSWLADRPEAALALVFVGVWVSVPFTTIMLHAGMQSIPREIYEAAALESNSLPARAWFITLPLLREVLAIVTLANFVLVFNSFPIIFIMTGGGPINRTDILATFLYREAFTNLNFGYASALAVIVLVILMGLSVAYVRLVVHRKQAE